MTVEAELHDGTILEFPDGTAPDVVQATVKKMLGQKEPAPEEKTLSFMETIKPFLSLAIPGGGGLKLMDEAAKASYELGGKVTDATGSPGLGYAANVASQAPTVLIGGGLGSKAAPAIEDTAKYLMGTALKPSLAERQSGKADTAIQTMLDEGLNVTRGGVDSLKQKIGDLNDKVKEVIANSTATVNGNAVANYLQFVLKKFENRPNAVEAQRMVEDAWTRFVRHPLAEGKSEIPVQTAQELKKGYQASVGEKAYGELKTAETESEKSIARGLREKISEAVPEVAGLNAQEQKMITTLKIAERRALMELNKNPGGLAILTHSPMTFAAYMADKSALFKSLAARMLNFHKGTIPTTVGAGAGATEDLLRQEKP